MTSALNSTVAAVTERVEARSKVSRQAYLDMIRRAAENRPARRDLGCSNFAHAFAACSAHEKERLIGAETPNLGIVTAYNDMLSAHQPYERFPEIIRRTAEASGATAQVAGGVPAMCDGVTQGRAGMEMSLFSREVIALSTAVALSHESFDAAIYLGVCDKIVPGLVIGAARFGHLPAVFLPAGPMTSGISNDEKAKTRQRYAVGEATRAELLASEMKSYHGPGTCTFYGTANSNQMVMEIMGLHLPGATFVNPNTPLRDALTEAGVKRALAITALGNDYIPAGEILAEKNFVNAVAGLHATGGSTNHALHLIAMARAAGILLTLEDFSELSDAVPLLARVYPNGIADVNHFHAAGGMQYVIRELLGAGLLHEDVRTIAGDGMSRYTQEPKLGPDGEIQWVESGTESLHKDILRPVSGPFQPTGGLKLLRGNLGASVIKVSAVKPDRHVIEAPARVFHSQEALTAAFKAGELERDVICVVRFQGPKANGMPELHSLTPPLSVLQDKGFRVALVTDGRMSGASGKVPAAIHLTPEAKDGGPIAKIRDGDLIRLDAEAGTLEVIAEDFDSRAPATEDLSAHEVGLGRELFASFRALAGPADQGAGLFSYAGM